MASRADIAELEPVYRGDAWEGLQLFYTYPGFDFSGVTASCYLRLNPEAPALMICETSTTVLGVGSLQVNVNIDEDDMRLLPTGTLYGDVQLYRASPRFGPKTWTRFQFDVIGDITYPDNTPEAVITPSSADEVVADSLILPYQGRRWQLRITGLTPQGYPITELVPI